MKKINALKRLGTFAAATVFSAVIFSDGISQQAVGSELTEGETSDTAAEETIPEIPEEVIPDEAVSGDDDTVPSDGESGWEEYPQQGNDDDEWGDPGADGEGDDIPEDGEYFIPDDVVGPGVVMDGPGAVEAPEGTEGSSSDDGSGSSSSYVAQSYDISAYADKLQEIAKEQERLEREIEATEDNIENQEKRQKAIQQKIDSVNEKIQVINSYLTTLEMEIAETERDIAEQKREIDQGIEDFKKRLRAMYLAGSDSYTNILLSSDDFYDVLMRMELVKRVAEHDNDLIDGLVEKKNEYEQTQKDLEEQQAEYDAQFEELSAQRAELERLYSLSETLKERYEKELADLEEQNKAYIEERSKFESSLSGILKSSYGNSSADTTREAAELAANAALEDIYEHYAQMKKNGEKIDEGECQYKFAWPVPGNYYISSGVGARWGSYHTGIDIPGAHGTDIHASESGTVVRVNTTCTHDYGKEGSCGCGGGYGNFVIIDHGNEFITLYGHMTSLEVNVGDKVKKGDVIGHMGSTGFSTGNHLHLEVRYQGYYLNPASYVSLR